MKVMQFSFILFMILIVGHFQCKGQADQTETESKRVQLKTMYDSRLYSFDPDGKLLQKDTTDGKGIIIQNSLPKGDRYYNPSGEPFGCAIFWTRVINETATPVELSINFPTDSFEILPSPGSYLNLFLPPDTMSHDKESMYNYGATGLHSFLDDGLNKPTKLEKTINPKEEFLFYIGALSYQPGGGVIRTGLVLTEKGLFYRVRIIPLFDFDLIPCGYITIQK